MTRILALVVVFLTGVQAIRSEDDLHEGGKLQSSGIEKEVAKMVCELGFKWEWPAYPQLGQKEHPCCEEAKKCVQGKANAACPTLCNLKVAGILDNNVSMMVVWYFFFKFSPRRLGKMNPNLTSIFFWGG